MASYGTGYGAYGQGATRASGSQGGSQAGPSAWGDGVEDLATQASAYTPGSNGTYSVGTNPSQKGKARKTVLKKAGGTVWEDQTLLEWDPAWYRFFVGNLGNDVNDDDLEAVFGNKSAIGVTTFVKAKVIRDPKTTKTKGFGFVAYENAEDYMKAWKAMDGKFVGSRPINIKKPTTQVKAVDIGERKAKKLESDLKKKHKEGGLRSQRGGGVQAGHGGQASYIRR